MVNKKTFPSIRINEDTHRHINQAIKKYNESSLVEMTIQDFRRLSYEVLAQSILQDKEINFKLKR